MIAKQGGEGEGWQVTGRLTTLFEFDKVARERCVAHNYLYIAFPAERSEAETVANVFDCEARQARERDGKVNRERSDCGRKGG